MKHFCVFHRNINGIRIKMKDLTQVYLSMGYTDVKTILASGNVVLSTDQNNLSKKDHREKIEMELSLYFEYEAYVILKDLEDITSILKESACHILPKDHHHYLLLSRDKTLASELVDIFETLEHGASESIIEEPSGLYWIVPKGQTLLSNFGKKVLGKKAYKSRLTSRNINTILKVEKELSKRVK